MVEYMKKDNKKTTNNRQLKLTKKLVLFVMPIIIFLLVALIIPKENFIKTTARKLFSGNTPVSKVEITTDDYDNEGSIKLTKEAHWVSKTEAELDLKLETIRKTGDNKKDIVLVFDVSGSMEGEKLDKVKEDASELIEYVLDKDEDNKVGLITFASESRIISPLSNNKEELLETINSISTEDSTNYYLAYKSIEEILSDYNKETGKDLVVLFMTDGSPTENAGATKGVYDSLKEQHPYMTLNAVEYEKGKTASDTKNISDGQWVANMDTLNNILFEATVSPESYEKLSVIDYIDDEYFEIETNTPTKGSITVDNNKITWRFANNSYITGTEETLKIRLKLKEEYQNTKGLYQTNKKTEIEYKINTEKETTSTDTPILKNNYDVYYDVNTPAECNLEEIESENHFVFDNVTKKDTTLSCAGYEFKGWDIEENVTKINDDTFIMPESDVHIRAIWTRQSINKSMDGKINEKTTLYKVIENEAKIGTYAQEYTGEHADAYDRSGTEKIYHYTTTSTNGTIANQQAEEILNKFNVIFGGFCWQILRTTDTGGVKLLYNGIPDSSGTCNNTGTAQQIGTSKYNDNMTSLAYVGYMYNKIYSYNYLNLSQQTIVLQRTTINKAHYFSKEYEYNQSVSNRYKLYDNPETDEDERFTAEECINSGNCNEVLKGTYTFSGTNPNQTAGSIRYVVGVTGEYIYFLALSSGQTLDDVNPMFYIGDGYRINEDNKYIITSSTEVNEFRKSEWVSKYSDSKNKYLCIGSNPCINPLYITNTAVLTYNYEDLANNYIYANDFDYILNEESGEYEYILKDTNLANKVQFWDWHAKYNTINNNHYTCFNTTGICKEIKYIYGLHNNKEAVYITLKEGKTVEDALNEMLHADDINVAESIIKAKIDAWYSENLSSYNNFLENPVFCYSRNIKTFAGWNPNGGSIMDSLLFNANNEDLKCSNETDSFNIFNEKAKLTYSIGLPTGPELKLLSNYLRNTGQKYWLGSPSGFERLARATNTIISGGGISNDYVYYSLGVRPVISLKPEIEYTDGDGSKNNPYIIDTSETDIGGNEP